MSNINTSYEGCKSKGGLKLIPEMEKRSQLFNVQVLVSCEQKVKAANERFIGFGQQQGVGGITRVPPIGEAYKLGKIVGVPKTY